MFRLIGHPYLKENNYCKNPRIRNVEKVDLLGTSQLHAYELYTHIQKTKNKNNKKVKKKKRVHSNLY